MWIEKKYLNIISHRLEGFHWKSNNLANFRCPYCGDSKKNKTKMRAFVYEKKGILLFMCHNCGKSTNASELIKHIDPTIHKQYGLEKFKELGGNIGNETKFSSDENENKKIFSDLNTNSKQKNTPKNINSILQDKQQPLKIDNFLTSIKNLPPEHDAKKFLLKRKIPEKYFSDLFYANDFKEFVNKINPTNEKELYVNEKRIIIPFYDMKENLIGFQGRSIEKDPKIRYITIKLEETHPKIYGLNKFNKLKPGYILEGPFDSMFLENSIALCGAVVTEIQDYIDKSKHVFVYDNEPRNGQICGYMKKIINFGFKIAIWPNDITQKDINEMILSGKSSTDIMMIIDRNTYSGLQADFRMQKWRKC